MKVLCNYEDDGSPSFSLLNKYTAKVEFVRQIRCYASVKKYKKIYNYNCITPGITQKDSSAHPRNRLRCCPVVVWRRCSVHF